MARSETDEIIGRMADTAVHLVNVNLGLLKRIAAGGQSASGGVGFDQAEQGGNGPAQDAWATWAESAGDVVQLSYLAAQLFDSVWGGRRTSADE